MAVRDSQGSPVCTPRSRIRRNGGRTCIVTIVGRVEHGETRRRPYHSCESRIPAIVAREAARLLAADQIHRNRLLFNADICASRKSRDTGALGANSSKP